MKTMLTSGFSQARALSTARLVTVILALGSIAIATADESLDERTHFDLPKAISHLQDEWGAKNIDTVMILHVPTSSDYVLEWSPARLDADCMFRLIVRDPGRFRLTKDLMAKIEKISASRSVKRAPLRWGFVFLTAKNERVLSIYVDKEGRKGAINETWVDFDTDELFRWAESTLGELSK